MLTDKVIGKADHKLRLDAASLMDPDQWQVGAALDRASLVRRVLTFVWTIGRFKRYGAS